MKLEFRPVPDKMALEDRIWRPDRVFIPSLGHRKQTIAMEQPMKINEWRVCQEDVRVRLPKGRHCDQNSLRELEDKLRVFMKEVTENHRPLERFEDHLVLCSPCSRNTSEMRITFIIWIVIPDYASFLTALDKALSPFEIQGDPPTPDITKLDETVFQSYCDDIKKVLNKRGSLARLEIAAIFRSEGLSMDQTLMLLKSMEAFGDIERTDEGHVRLKEGPTVIRKRLQ
jgi:hypothetical protein